MPGDAELLERWNGGDSAAGDELFTRYFDPLYRFFRSKAPLACKELVQNTLTAAVEKRSTLRDAASFRAFLYGIARIELLRWFRKQARSGEAVVLSEASVYDLDPSPSRYAARKQEHRLLLEALRRIPIDLQIVVELYYWESLGLAEIAEVIEVPVGTVKSRLHRARQQIAEIAETIAADRAVLESTTAGFEGWIAEVKEHLG